MNSQASKERRQRAIARDAGKTPVDRRAPGHYLERLQGASWVHVGTYRTEAQALRAAKHLTDTHPNQYRVVPHPSLVKTDEPVEEVPEVAL